VLPSTGVVQEESVGRRWHPFFQQWDQLTSGDERRGKISEHVNDTGAVQRNVDQQVSVVGDQGAFDVELESLAFYAESPRQKCAARKPQPDAVMGLKVLRRLRSRMPRQVIWRGNDVHTEVIGDAHRDHIARDPMSDANPCVVSTGDYIGQEGVD